MTEILNTHHYSDYKNNQYALELFKKAGVNVVHIPFDPRKIDFLKDEKVNLAFEMLEEMTSLGATPEQLAPLQKRVNELFGSFVKA